jgi:DNA-binding YbaB/EbfC family protein
MNTPFGKLPGGIGGLLKAAEQAKRAEEEFAAARVTGQAGGGLVNAVVNGKGELIEIKISKSVVDPHDVETLEDLVTVAVREAIDKANVAREEKLRSIIPGDLAGRLPGGLF